jgi:hypothetical protein
MNLIRRAIVTLLLPAALSVPAAVRDQPAPAQSIRVLFIGNSYTYFNDLPEIFTRLAGAGRSAAVEARMIAPGGWRLRDHWEKGEARKALHEPRWDYVVLQDQSTLGVNYYLEGKPHVAGDEVFKPYAEKWAAEIQKTGATPVFYLTWARKACPEDQAALNYAYARAAKESRSPVAPVGVAWAWARRQHPEIELFAGDGSHPSPAGSYLAACTLYATIFQQSPVGLPGRITGAPVDLRTEKPEPDKTATLVDLPEEQARALQSAAWAAWRELRGQGGYPSVSPVSPPTVAPLPAGVPLSSEKLEGTWGGEVLFYPVGPVEMVLELSRDGAIWKGRLELKYRSKAFADEALDLSDLNVRESELTFSDPKSAGVDNLPVQFRGVSPGPGELQGIAETLLDKPDSKVRLLGSWKLRRR